MLNEYSIIIPLVVLTSYLLIPVCGCRKIKTETKSDDDYRHGEEEDDDDEDYVPEEESEEEYDSDDENDENDDGEDESVEDVKDAVDVQKDEYVTALKIEIYDWWGDNSGLILAGSDFDRLKTIFINELINIGVLSNDDLERDKRNHTSYINIHGDDDLFDKLNGYLLPITTTDMLEIDSKSIRMRIWKRPLIYFTFVYKSGLENRKSEIKQVFNDVVSKL